MYIGQKGNRNTPHSRATASETASESTEGVVKNSDELERIVLINQANTPIFSVLDR